MILFKINDLAVNSVTTLIINRPHRLDARNTCLDGSLVVDRSAQKYSLLVTLGLVSVSELKDIETELANDFTATFEDMGVEKTISAVATDSIARPSPFYPFNDKTREGYFKNIRLTIEEL